MVVTKKLTYYFRDIEDMVSFSQPRGNKWKHNQSEPQPEAQKGRAASADT